MGSSPISPLRLVTSDLPIEPSVVTTMTSVHAVNPILDTATVKQFHALSNEKPSQLKGCDSLFSTDKQKKNTNESVLKDVKGSNRVNNKKKAQGQVIALSLTTLIGAILAPLTGGMSLIPTAFLVVYGNAAALAMYGGSQSFVNDKQKAEEKDDPIDIPPTDKYSPVHSSDNVEVPKEPNSAPNNLSEESIENDLTDSAGVKSDKINQRIIEDMAKAGQIVAPEYLIERENIATLENPVLTEPMKDTVEWVIFNNGDVGDDHTVLMDAIDQASKMPIDDSTDFAPNIDLLDFSIPIEGHPELADLNISLDSGCVASNSIHEDDNIKIFAIRNMADITEPDKTKIVSQEHLAAPKKFKFTVKAPDPIITTQGSSRLGSNRSAGVRNNMDKPNATAGSVTSKQPTKLMAQMSESHVATPSVGMKNKAVGVNKPHEPLAPRVSKPSPKYTIKMSDPIVTTQGSSRLGSNNSAGVRNNTGKASSKNEPALSSRSNPSPELMATKSDAYVTPRAINGKGHYNSINDKAGSLSSTVEQPSQKYSVKTIPPIITTQGSVGLGSNNSAGVRNNTGKASSKNEPALSSRSNPSPELIATKSDTYVTPRSINGKGHDNSINDKAGFLSSKVEQPSQKYSVKTIPPIITTQGSVGLGSNNSAGVRNNTGKASSKNEQALSSRSNPSPELIATKSDTYVTPRSINGKGHDNSINDKAGFLSSKVEQPSQKYSVKTIPPIITTQGSVGLGSNNSAGVRNNTGKASSKNESALSSRSNPSSELMATKSDTYVTPRSINGKGHDNSISDKAGFLSSKVEQSSQKYSVKTIPPIITTQGSAALGSNNSAGIRHNFKEIHNENVSKLASWHWKTTGIDNPVTLNLMGNALAIAPVNLSKLDYFIEKGKAS